MSQLIKSGKPRFGLDNDLFKALRTRATAVMAFVVFALLSVVGIDRLNSGNDQPNLGLFGKKVDFLRRNHDRFNVLFIGTSTIYRAVDPILLQEVAASKGCDVRAFNLGVSKLRLTELRYIKEQLPARMIGDYDLIVLSPMAASGIEVANWPSSRVQYFSDWAGYKSSLIDLWEYPATKRLPRVFYNASLLTGAFLYNQLGIGDLTNSLEGWPGTAAANTTDDVFDGGALVDFSRHGFIALDDEPDEQFKSRRNAILNNSSRFEKLKTSGPEITQFEGPAAERAWRRYQRSMDYFTDLDVPILMFLPPMVARRTQDKALADYATSMKMPLLNYNRIDRYPELFDLHYWFDYYHTNKAGATAVTQQLGQDICSFMNDKGA